MREHLIMKREQREQQKLRRRKKQEIEKLSLIIMFKKLAIRV